MDRLKPTTPTPVSTQSDDGGGGSGSESSHTPTEKFLTPLKTEEEKLASTAKARTPFAMKTRESRPSDYSEESNTSGSSGQPKPIEKRKDVRFSREHGRYSFNVDVKGPIISKIDPYRVPPEMAESGTQTMMVYDVRRESQGTATTDSYRDSYSSDAAGDASTNLSDLDEEGNPDKKKSLERKESKRREAETLAVPRGYRKLDLQEDMPSLPSDAETQVTAQDLDNEIAMKLGITISPDNILWPTCKDFNTNTMIKKIEDYVKTCWKIDPKWLFVVQPLEEFQTSFRKRFVFEVKFSMPSPTTPVPPATASVFFTFEIPVYSSQNEPVTVSYVLEGTRFAHKPGKIPFQDKWLREIIADKLRIQRAINF